MKFPILPTKLYEVLRWLVWTVLPDSGVFLGVLNAAWGWNLPMEPILATLGGTEAFLGAVLGISKLVNDKRLEKESQ